MMIIIIIMIVIVIVMIMIIIIIITLLRRIRGALERELSERWNQGLESGLCHWAAGQGLVQKECFSTDTGSRDL